jgi:hypothetical protein
VKGRIWLIAGVVLGIAVGIGKVPYIAGAADSLSDTAQRVVGTAGLSVIGAGASHGAPRRVVEGLTALVGALVPGVTALILVYAARTTLRVRALIAILLAALGGASFVYLPAGHATGVAVLAFAAAGVVFMATGPIVAAPLAGLAALIGTTFLPRLFAAHSTLPQLPVIHLHQAIFGDVGSPLWLRVVVLAVAAVPFAWAARVVLR